MVKRIVTAFGWTMCWCTFMNLTAMAQGEKVVSRQNEGKWTIAIHGGAGADPARWTEEQINIRLEGLRTALQIGVDRLKLDGQAMDVVENVIRSLEDNPYFNAGRGAVLNEDGKCALDASIMDGRDLACGAVAGVKRVKNPITLSRRVITDTVHAFLIGDGADRLAEKLGLDLEEAEYFITDEQIKSWEKWKEREATKGSTSWTGPVGVDDPLFYLGTVGCVVLDSQGNLAAGTSTGGLLGKRWGRIGDSPVIGAGTYAKNATCAVSCTGIGELYIRHAIAISLSMKMELANQSLEQVANEAIQKVLPEDSGGLIAVDHDGNISMPFNTPGMARGAATSAGRFEVRLGKDGQP